MNNVSLVGRLTADPELRYTQDNRAYCRVYLAVDRGLSKEDRDAGKQSADFISCICWNKTAENLAKYMKKGSQVSIVGRIITGSYENNDGNTVYTTDVRVNQLHFLDRAKGNGRPDPEYDGQETEQPTEEKTPPETLVDEDPFKDFGDQVTIEDEDLPF